MKKKSLKRILIVLGILFLPSLFWLLLTTGKNNFRHLEIFGPKDVNANGDTIYHTIPPFSFINQEGKIITDKNLDNKIFVANFFFATCPTVCPKMNENLRGIVENYKDVNNIRFLSFTVNPERDSVPVLAEYAQKRNADPGKWWFLTGNKDSIYTLAGEGFKLMAAKGKTADDFFHDQNLVLVDKEKRIRGFYDGLDDNDIRKLNDEIKVLLYEYADRK
jgi:protein SCO1/2